MFFDTPKNYQLGFQDPATPIMSGIIDLHHSIFFYLLLILISVLFFGKNFIYCSMDIGFYLFNRINIILVSFFYFLSGIDFISMASCTGAGTGQPYKILLNVAKKCISKDYVSRRPFR